MKSTFTKVAAAAAVLAGMSTAAQAAWVELRIFDFNSTTSVTEAFKSCSTFDAASVAACTATGFLTGGVGSTSVQFGTGLQVLAGFPTFLAGFAASGVIGVFDIASTSATSNSPGAPNPIDGVDEGLLNRSQTEMLRSNRVGTSLGAALNDTHQLFVDFRAFDYALPIANDKLVSSSASFSANANGWAATDTVTTNFIVDKDNGLATTLSQSCTMAPTTGLGQPTSDNCNLSPAGWTDNGGLYSIRSTQIFSVARGTTMNSTANMVVRAVPEPMSTALVGIALFGLALAGRRGVKKA